MKAMKRSQVIIFRIFCTKADFSTYAAPTAMFFSTYVHHGNRSSLNKKENVLIKMDDFPCKQGKLDLGVIPADELGCFFTENFFSVFIKWGSLSMSAGVNPMNFWLI
jgi:hypothetical protein